MPASASLEERPPLVIPTTDLLSLREIVTATHPSDPRAAEAAWLAEELDRAAVVAPEAFPPRVITMHAEVSYRDDVTDQVGRMKLVYLARRMRRDMPSRFCHRLVQPSSVCPRTVDPLANTVRRVPRPEPSSACCSSRTAGRCQRWPVGRHYHPGMPYGADIPCLSPGMSKHHTAPNRPVPNRGIRATGSRLTGRNTAPELVGEHAFLIALR